MLTGAMLVGTALGFVGGILSTLVITAPIRPDAAIALVVAVPSGLGLMLVLAAGRRWMTALGAGVLAVAPSLFATMVAIQVVHGG